jgi:hypothetical protein
MVYYRDFSGSYGAILALSCGDFSFGSTPSVIYWRRTEISLSVSLGKPLAICVQSPASHQCTFLLALYIFCPYEYIGCHYLFKQWSSGLSNFKRQSMQCDLYHLSPIPCSLLSQLCFSVCIIIWAIVGFVIGNIRTFKVWIYTSHHFSHRLFAPPITELWMACQWGHVVRDFDSYVVIVNANLIDLLYL